MGTSGNGSGRKNGIKYSFVIIPAVLIILYIVSYQSLFSNESAEMIGKSIPDITLYDLEKVNGTPLKEKAGNNSLLVLWATWCEPCVRELKALNVIRKEYRERGIEFVFINYDVGSLNELQTRISSWVQKNNLSLNIFFEPNQVLLSQLKIHGLPALVGIGQKGEVKFIDVGEKDWDKKTLEDIDKRLKN